MSAVLQFCKNNNFSYKLLPHGGVLVEKKFVLLSKEHGNFSSNLPVYKVDYSVHKKWLSIFSKELQLGLGKKVLRLVKSFVPRYEYSDTQLRKSWNAVNSDSSRGGYKLVKHFHHSLLSCNYYKKPSPLQFFSNKKNVLKVVLNRLVYSPSRLSSNYLLDGANTSKLNPRVSIFSPSLAKQLLLTYAREASTVLDPFSGFSGRLLGTLATGKSYVGSDVRRDTVEESQRLLSYLGYTADLTVCDYRNRSNVSADVLLSCPPYGNKEHYTGVPTCDNEDTYVQYVLNNYNCSRYLFVVKNTKYSNNVVCTLRNGSWVSSKSNEVVLLFNK